MDYIVIFTFLSFALQTQLQNVPHLAINLLQIIITTSINSMFCWKEQFTRQLCPRIWLVSKIFGYCPPKSHNWKFFQEIFALPTMRFSGNCLFKRQAGQVLAKSLDRYTLWGFRMTSLIKFSFNVSISVFVLGPYALVLLPVGRWHLRCVSGQTGYHALVC